MKLEVNGIEELEFLAKKILEYAKQEKIFMFYGEMGAGKTTLINSICTALGTKDHTSSPTFSIVNEYELNDGSIYHFDFYRLKNQSEAFDLGYEDYFYSGNYCFIEWPEKIADLWPESFVEVRLMVLDKNRRMVELTKVG
ncbi:tRNA (adenosine(37)-N6)-threonylcarbamoyltransferase complex ATPase subunit type 1 TsaE [Pedobacter alpinus]|uniref:tRNA threonylcarbamoyladenosine biosynthesis protein TsaE n=1 Tax=Pedobacter alpinus TaxID=1590643 RepID=A0ABW5TQQ9_9SPHI